MSTATQVQQLTDSLTKMLAEKATIDERIVAVRNTIQGINLGVKLKEELIAEEEAKQAKEAETQPEE